MAEPEWTHGAKAVYTTGTVSQPNSSMSDWTINIRSEDSILGMLIYTDGPVQFSGPIFESNPDYFTHKDKVGVSVVQNYTEIAGAVPLELTPLTLLHGSNVTFRVLNASGAARKWQIWLLR